MKFLMYSLSGKNKTTIYYITVNSSHIVEDYDLCKFLNISVEEYQEELITNFNGFIEDEDVYFHNDIDCENALNYINEKYGIILAMLGE